MTCLSIADRARRARRSRRSGTSASSSSPCSVPSSPNGPCSSGKTTSTSPSARGTCPGSSTSGPRSVVAERHEHRRRRRRRPRARGPAAAPAAPGRRRRAPSGRPGRCRRAPRRTRSRSIARSTPAAVAQQTACSLERPPKTTATRGRRPAGRLWARAVGAHRGATLSPPCRAPVHGVPRRTPSRARDDLHPEPSPPPTLAVAAGRPAARAGRGAERAGRALLDVRRRAAAGRLRPRRQPDLGRVRGGARGARGRRRAASSPPAWRRSPRRCRPGAAERRRRRGADARLQRHQRLLRELAAARSADGTRGSTSPTPTPSRAALRGADLLWLESPTNPMLEVADLPALVAAAPRGGRARRRATTPSRRRCVQRPLDARRRRRRALGDQVPGRALRRHPRRRRDRATTAALRERLPAHRTLHGVDRRAVRGLAGAARPAHAAPARRAGAARTPRELARRLAGHPAVARVRYPGLPDDPGHERASADAGFGAIVASSRRRRGAPSACDRGCGCTRRAWAASSRPDRAAPPATRRSRRRPRGPAAAVASASRTSRTSGRDLDSALRRSSRWRS